MSQVEFKEIKPGIFHFRNLLSKEECEEIIQHGEKTSYKQVPTTGGRQLVWCGVEASEVRNNQRIIEECTEFTRRYSATIFERVAKHLPKDLEFRFKSLPTEVNRADVCPTLEKAKEWKLFSVSDKFRMYKYEKKQHFLKHFDGTNKRILSLTEGKKPVKQFTEQSFMTFLVYLNDVEKGGETQFFDTYSKEETFDIKPEMGSGVVFLHELLHQGNDVLGGVKYLLRTDICYMKQKEIVEDGQKNINYIMKVSADQKKNKNSQNNILELLPQGDYAISEWQKIFHPSCQHYTD